MTKGAADTPLNTRNGSELRVALYGFRSGAGGVGRVMINLMNGLLAERLAVDLLLPRGGTPDLDGLHAGVRVLELDRQGLAARVWGLRHYLGTERPAVLLANKEYANRAAILARHLAQSSTRVIIRVGTTLSAALERRSMLKRWLRRRAIVHFYQGADSIIAVSRGVANDTAAVTGVAPEHIHVIYNPIVTPQIARHAQRPVNHPWFSGGNPPVILGVGRLARPKDFPTLLQAFATVRAQRNCRLVILGEGKERAPLLRLAEQLGIIDDVDLPGYAANPFAYMSRAQLLALSSSWEGSPNVLIEALAVGLPVVATDCKSGPREILQDGRYGRLVPVGDAAALAKAMVATLDRPPDRSFLQDAVHRFRVETSARAYCQAMGIPVAPPKPVV